MDNINLKIGSMLFAFLLLVLLIGWLPQENKTSTEDFPVLKGPYLGQKPPGMTPKIFLPEVFEGDLHTTAVFSPDGNEVYWGPMEGNMLYMRLENNLWKPPKVVPFASEYVEGEPFFSYDGTKLFFISTRPLDGAKTKLDENIWYVEKVKEGWSKPKPLGPEINSMSLHWEFSLSRNGNLYFSSEGDIYRSLFKEGNFTKPEKLAIAINTEHREATPFIAADESYIIFARDTTGYCDLYISFRKKDGSWSQAENMKDINTKENHELWPMVSYDGNYLFFLRNFGDQRDLKVHWVDAKVIETLKPEEIK